MFIDNIKCKIGLHKYLCVGEQTLKGVVNSMSGAPLTRITKICKRCGKIKYISLDTSSSFWLEHNSTDWYPKLGISLQYRKIKINKIMKVL